MKFQTVFVFFSKCPQRKKIAFFIEKNAILKEKFQKIKTKKKKMKFHNLDIPCYENVIYLSQTEFESLIDTFDRLNRSMGRSKTRIAFQQALILQASSLLGSASEEVVKEKTLGEIWGDGGVASKCMCLGYQTLASLQSR